MNLTTITSTDFKKIVALLKRKDALAAQMAKVDLALSAFQGGEAAPEAAAAAPAKGGKRHQRGRLKDAIIELVKTSGKGGITVGEIAGRLKTKRANIYVWFGSTGKKVKQIKKLAEATYGWVG